MSKDYNPSLHIVTCDEEILLPLPHACGNLVNLNGIPVYIV